MSHTTSGMCAAAWEVLAYLEEHNLEVTLVQLPAVET